MPHCIEGFPHIQEGNINLLTFLPDMLDGFLEYHISVKATYTRSEPYLEWANVGVNISAVI